MTKATFRGKEYDTISMAPSYMVAALITNAMDTDDSYRVDADTKIAILTDSDTGEVVGLFHVLDVDAVITHLQQRGVEVSISTGSAPSKAIVTLTSGIRRVVFEAMGNLSSRGLSLIADVEEVTIQHFTKYDEEYGWEETSNAVQLGLKRSDPTGYFISELEHTLTYS